MKKTVAITVDRPVEDLYVFWRDLSNLPLLIDDLEVVMLPDGKARWQTTVMGRFDLEWTSRIIEDRVNEKIAWESAEDTTIQNEGMVTFRPAPANRGVEVRLTLAFDPPGGQVGEAVARLVGPAPHVLAYKTLYRFKALMETGEIPTTDHQPAARNGGQDD